VVGGNRVGKLIGEDRINLRLSAPLTIGRQPPALAALSPLQVIVRFRESW